MLSTLPEYESGMILEKKNSALGSGRSLNSTWNLSIWSNIMMISNLRLSYIFPLFCKFPTQLTTHFHEQLRNPLYSKH